MNYGVGDLVRVDEYGACMEVIDEEAAEDGQMIY